MVAVHAYDRTDVAAQFPPCPQTCGTSEGRIEFGCRRPIPKDVVPRFALQCYGCKGETKSTCGVCGGEGRIDLRRCPNTMYGSRELFVLQAADVMRAGHMPNGQAFGDLPATLWDGMALVAQVRQHIKEHNQETDHDG